MQATAATATRPAASAYSTRSWPRVSFHTRRARIDCFSCFMCAFSFLLLHRRVNDRADLGEHGANRRAQTGHRRDRGNSHQTGSQRILHEVLAPRVAEKPFPGNLHFRAVPTPIASL